MQTRSAIIDEFLARSGLIGAEREILAADASFRRYERVYAQGRPFVLMDAPPDKEDIRPFIHIGEQLVKSGFSAPEIYARDVPQGLLLLEDLGEGLFTRLLHSSPKDEEALYLAASEVLVAFYEQAARTDLSSFMPYDTPLMMREVSLFTEWFLPAAMGRTMASGHSGRYAAIWEELTKKIPPLRPVLVLRDYHADNLMWLPDRAGIKRVGLLDFQDGVAGSPAYDMVSFLEDARRDVTPATVDKVLEAYITAAQISAEDFMTSYALLGAQRNCKIIGIFVRLAVRDGKRQYLSYLPRVWKHLEHDLKHPALRPLADFMDEIVPGEWRGIIEIPENDGMRVVT